MWNDDEIKGKAEKAKGKAKQAVGDLTDDNRLRDEGVRRKVGEVVEKVGKTIKR